MKHVYGFIEAGEATDFGPIGGDGATVYSVAHDEIAAVISDTSSTAIGSLPQQELVKCLAQYQSVAETIMKAGHTILPMKFGTALQSEAHVAEMLRANSSKLHGLLADIEGLFEIEVVAMWPDSQQVFEEIGGQRDIVELKRRIAKLPPGESLAQRLHLGKLVKDRLEAKRRAIQERILPAWQEVARGTVRHEIRYDAMVVNAAFLLDAEGRDRLEALVRKADSREGNSLNFRVVGPLPPYSFSTVQLQRAQIAELDVARRDLALPERITPQIVAAGARSAMRLFHPDTNLRDRNLPQKFERVKAAADLLKRFCLPEGLDFRDAGCREFLLIEPMEAP